MGSLRRRVDAVEGQIGARASPGERLPWRTLEEEAAREEGFRNLFEQMGWPWPPEPKGPEDAFEELFAEIAAHREAIDRKEQRA